MVELYILLVRAHLRNIYQPHPSLYWLLEAYYYIIVALTSIDSSLLDVYKEEINIFSNKLVSILLQNSKYDYIINLEEGKMLPQVPIYNLLQKELQILREYLESALKKSWIRPSKSPTRVPILFILKVEGIIRLYVNYRRLNKIIIKNQYSLLLVGELFNGLSYIKIFIKLAFYNIYYRIYIKKGDKQKTIFKTPYSHFKYLIMPFSFTNASITF